MGRLEWDGKQLIGSFIFLFFHWCPQRSEKLFVSNRAELGGGTEVPSLHPIDARDYCGKDTACWKHQTDPRCGHPAVSSLPKGLKLKERSSRSLFSPATPYLKLSNPPGPLVFTFLSCPLVPGSDTYPFISIPPSLSKTSYPFLLLIHVFFCFTPTSASSFYLLI